MAPSIQDSLGDLLDCQICYDKLRPPIQTCKNGHGICEHCRKNVTNCGVCRENFSNSSNTLLNQIAERLPVQCTYRNQGCNKTPPLGQLSIHEKICLFRREKCIRCFGEFFMLEMNEHIKICIGKSEFKATFSRQITLNFLTSEIESHLFFSSVFITDIQTFLLFRCTLDQNKMYIAVQYMGKDQENAGKYRYDIKINQGLSNSYITYTGFCVPYVYSFQEMKKQKGKIELDFESIFLTENMLLSKHFDLALTISELDESKTEERCIICGIEVPLTEMNDHINDHTENFETSDKLVTTFSATEFIECSVTDREDHHHRLIYMADIQTYFLWRSITNQNKIAFCVQYMGKDQENAGEYKYDIRNYQGLPDSFLCCSGLCVPYIHSDEETKKQMNMEIKFLKNDTNSSKKLEITLNRLQVPNPEVKCLRCDSEIPTSEMNDHVKDCEYSTKTETTFSTETVIECKIANTEHGGCYLIFITDIQTHFLVRWINNPPYKTLLFVHYMGKDQENAGKYRYEIKINQGLPNAYISCSGLCVPYIYSLEETKAQKRKIKLDFESILLTNEALLSKKYEFVLTLSEIKASGQF